jgi:hypothetical protein
MKKSRCKMQNHNAKVKNSAYRPIRSDSAEDPGVSEDNLKKQSQFISVQCSAFSGQRQDEETILQSKANSFRIEYCVMRIAKRNLKKQSQFAPAKNGAKSFAGEDYENKPRPELQENKVKTKPKQAYPFDKPLWDKLSASSEPIQLPLLPYSRLWLIQGKFCRMEPNSKSLKLTKTAERKELQGLLK